MSVKCYACKQEGEWLARSTVDNVICDECYISGACLTLDMATTDQLWDAIKTRFRSCVLIYEQEAKKKDYLANGQCWWGSLACILGLCHYGVRKAKQALRRADRGDEEEGHKPL